MLTRLIIATLCLSAAFNADAWNEDGPGDFLYSELFEWMGATYEATFIAGSYRDLYGLDYECGEEIGCTAKPDSEYLALICYIHSNVRSNAWGRHPDGLHSDGEHVTYFVGCSGDGPWAGADEASVTQGNAWVEIKEVSGGESIESIKFTEGGIEYTATFLYGAYDDLFTADHSTCGILLNGICGRGQEEAHHFADGIIGALGNQYATGEDGLSDEFYIPFKPEGDEIRVQHDKSKGILTDECCDQSTVSRSTPAMWVRLDPPPRGTAQAKCGSDAYRSEGEETLSSSGSRIASHVWNEGTDDYNEKFLTWYKQYPLDEPQPFPDPDHACAQSYYKGTLSLEPYDFGSDNERFTNLSSVPLVIDLAKQHSLHQLYEALGSESGAFTKTLKIEHSSTTKIRPFPR